VTASEPVPGSDPGTPESESTTSFRK
jgi:hypothetical protein